MAFGGIPVFILGCVAVFSLYNYIQKQKEHSANGLRAPIIPSMDEMEHAIHSGDGHPPSESPEGDPELMNDIEDEMVSRYGHENGKNFKVRKDIMYNRHADSDKFLSEAANTAGEVSKGSLGSVMGVNQYESYAPAIQEFVNPTYSTNLIGRTDIANSFSKVENANRGGRDTEANSSEKRVRFNVDNSVYTQN
jgi:hypothetical protein